MAASTWREVVADRADAAAQRQLAQRRLESAALAFDQTGDTLELERLIRAAREYGAANRLVEAVTKELAAVTGRRPWARKG